MGTHVERKSNKKIHSEVDAVDRQAKIDYKQKRRQLKELELETEVDDDYGDEEYKMFDDLD